MSRDETSWLLTESTEASNPMYIDPEDTTMSSSVLPRDSEMSAYEPPSIISEESEDLMQYLRSDGPNGIRLTGGIFDYTRIYRDY
jgi:hypothetical protein